MAMIFMAMSLDPQNCVRLDMKIFERIVEYPPDRIAKIKNWLHVRRHTVGIHHHCAVVQKALIAAEARICIQSKE